MLRNRTQEEVFYALGLTEDYQRAALRDTVTDLTERLAERALAEGWEPRYYYPQYALVRTVANPEWSEFRYWQLVLLFGFFGPITRFNYCVFDAAEELDLDAYLDRLAARQAEGGPAEPVPTKPDVFLPPLHS